MSLGLHIRALQSCQRIGNSLMRCLYQWHHLCVFSTDYYLGTTSNLTLVILVPSSCSPRTNQAIMARPHFYLLGAVSHSCNELRYGCAKVQPRNASSHRCAHILSSALRSVDYIYVAWYQEHGAGVESGGGTAGRSFYTSLGHLNETWKVRA